MNDSGRQGGGRRKSTALGHSTDFEDQKDQTIRGFWASETILSPLNVKFSKQWSYRLLLTTKRSDPLTMADDRAVIERSLNWNIVQLSCCCCPNVILGSNWNGFTTSLCTSLCIHICAVSTSQVKDCVSYGTVARGFSSIFYMNQTVLSGSLGYHQAPFLFIWMLAELLEFLPWLIGLSSSAVIVNQRSLGAVCAMSPVCVPFCLSV
jgi:hypothetical protein